MYLWRNLPEGQLLAVLRWLQAHREAGQPAGGTPPAKSPSRAAESATTPSR